MNIKNQYDNISRYIVPEIHHIYNTLISKPRPAFVIRLRNGKIVARNEKSVEGRIRANLMHDINDLAQEDGRQHQKVWVGFI